MTFGSLFAGIGGFDLGLERAGMTCKWQVEIDPYATRVLEKHWPHVRRYGDIRTIDWADVEPVDLVCGGFPCQDVSDSGPKVGLSGERSGLWAEMARAVRLIQPRYVIVENVSALLGRGLGRVLGDLAACGYDAEWECIPASAFGAPHRRDRIWIIAYPAQELCVRAVFPGRFDAEGLEKGYQRVRAMLRARRAGGRPPADFRRLHTADGFSAELDAISGLGNAVIPQAAEWIGRRILDAEGRAA